MTTVKAVSPKEAKAINERLGLAYDDEQRTFWAYDETHDEIYDFDSMRERDYFISTINERNEVEAANELVALERDAKRLKGIREKWCDDGVDITDEMVNDAGYNDFEKKVNELYDGGKLSAWEFNELVTTAYYDYPDLKGL